MLWQVSREHTYQLALFEGGSKRNAIPREARAEVVVAGERVEEFRQALQSCFGAVKSEFKSVEKGMEIKVEKLSAETPQVCDEHSQSRLMNMLFGLPHGVLAMSQDIPDLVETSNNVATVEWSENRAKIGLSSRSSIGTALQATRDMLRALADMAGAQIEQPEGYPGWTPNLDSPVLHVVKEVHKDLFGKDAEMKAIHAGLECGLIGERFPGMDMVSFGPDLQHPHSPDERVRIGSVQNFWILLTATLKKMAEK